MNKTRLADALSLATRTLKDVAGERARFEARLLVGHILGVDPVSLGLSESCDLTPREMHDLEKALARRVAHEPISRIMGKRAFWTFECEISPHTLDPRPDSETLVEAALARLPHDTCGRLVDFGTGSGCLMIALLSERPNLLGVGVDISPKALKVARRNAHTCGVENRAQFVCSHWDQGLTGSFDVIISNPPYIPWADIEGLAKDVKDYDPHGALTPGPSGLEAYEHLAVTCARLLTKDGFCALEIGMGQEKDVTRLFEAQGFTLTSAHKDLQGIVRCLVFDKETLHI